MIRVGVLTISDRAAGGVYEDRSGPAVRATLTSAQDVEVARYAVVADNTGAIQQTLVTWADHDQLDIILTTGGTGFAPGDVTPEATRGVIERDAPGLVFAMLRHSLSITPHAILSRAVAGIRGRTLIVNLPGSPKAAQENLSSILSALPHAVELLRGVPMRDAGHAPRTDTSV